MIRNIFILCAIAQASLVQSQLISFKDGKIGVNFAGYHAEAGLGGLITGNAAHGGLSASAGTPYGQQAGAGIGGTTHGRMAGGAYAGATAGNGVGASAAIGGNYDNEGGHGGSGAEAHANGITRKVVRLTQAENGVAPQTLTVVQKNIPVAAELDSRSSIESDEQDVKLVEVKPTQPPQVVYQKVKRKYRPHKYIYRQYAAPTYTKQVVYQPNPSIEYGPQNPPAATVATADALDYRKFFDFGFFANAAAGFGGPQHAVAPPPPQPQQYIVQKRIEATPIVHKEIYQQKVVERSGLDEPAAPPAEGGIITKAVTYDNNVAPNGGTFFDNIFNIPIGVLKSVNTLLNSRGTVQKTYSVQSTQ